ncbi:hypothetical protein VFC49_07025 [Thermococcus sp. SY098]|uniref:hypothetical protein n=1 Tax=Thermococcus sp. SY098 TaxID=3111325 RepID=UPI002D79E2FB|nr:hypothetical protein [Thermococcus sp. SY098]WRS51838.1 hypothetical protein VFC49_07025 [Thermococcus sp. SY098]
MKSKSLIQLILFITVIGIFAKFGWSIITKEAAFFGAIGGLILHWALTNKGNRNIINIRPLSAGWRVLIYDILLCTFLIALLQQAGSFSTFLSSLAALNEKTALVVVALVAGIITDYAVGR